MIKKLKKRKTTRRKFISGIGLISAGIILRPLSLFSQEENPILNIGSPIDFLSEKLISNFQKKLIPQLTQSLIVQAQILILTITIMTS